jgi:hypothetical protein
MYWRRRVGLEAQAEEIGERRERRTSSVGGGGAEEEEASEVRDWRWERWEMVARIVWSWRRRCSGAWSEEEEEEEEEERGREGGEENRRWEEERW